jgi:hypothetical protein
MTVEVVLSRQPANAPKRRANSELCNNVADDIA